MSHTVVGRFITLLLVLPTLLVAGQASVSSDTPEPLSVDGGSGELIFVSRQLDTADIYWMRADGTDQRRLTNGAGYHFSPAWSPDGEYIVFSATPDTDIEFQIMNTELYIMKADGSNQQRLTNNTIADHNPVWSPDGGNILYTSCEEIGQCYLYLMNVDGSQVRRLTRFEEHEYGPAWSVDGSHIAASITGADGYAQLYLIAADGSSRVQLTTHPMFHQFPAWSPDEQFIAFNLTGEGSSRLYLVNVDGTDVRLFPGARDDVDESGLDWSPDGTQVAFSSNRDGNFEIYLMNADGTDPRRLTTSPNIEAEVKWRPMLHN
jgi:Tol biopolymer transport system component